MNVENKKDFRPATDFFEMWKSIRSRTSYTLSPVRRRFACDCGYHCASYEMLFVHTSQCAAAPFVVCWNGALVVMPERELRLLHGEWTATGLCRVSVESLRQRIAGISEFYRRSPGSVKLN